MSFIPLGVVWAGYMLTWYGYSLVRGPGMGLLDLVVPGRGDRAESVIKGWSGGKQPSFDQPNGGSFVNAIGTQQGSIYNPAPAKGGMVTKPVLGKTPPSGYGSG